MGAILLMASDVRIGAAGDYKIGMNEVAIGMPVPRFATEFADDRLSRRHLDAAIGLATIYDPAGAVEAGFLDELVEGDRVIEVARATRRRTGRHAARGALRHDADQPQVGRRRIASRPGSRPMSSSSRCPSRLT